MVTVLLLLFSQPLGSNLRASYFSCAIFTRVRPHKLFTASQNNSVFKELIAKLTLKNVLPSMLQLSKFPSRQDETKSTFNLIKQKLKG